MIFDRESISHGPTSLKIAVVGTLLLFFILSMKYFICSIKHFIDFMNFLRSESLEKSQKVSENLGKSRKISESPGKFQLTVMHLAFLSRFFRFWLICERSQQPPEASRKNKRNATVDEVDKDMNILGQIEP